MVTITDVTEMKSYTLIVLSILIVDPLEGNAQQYQRNIYIAEKYI